MSCASIGTWSSFCSKNDNPTKQSLASYLNQILTFVRLFGPSLHTFSKEAVVVSSSFAKAIAKMVKCISRNKN